MKNIKVFYLKIFSFLEVKFSIYLNRRVFVMSHQIHSHINTHMNIAKVSELYMPDVSFGRLGHKSDPDINFQKSRMELNNYRRPKYKKLHYSDYVETFYRGPTALASHYDNMPIQIYCKVYHQKMEKKNIKNFWKFSYFCSKYRLWVLVRTASSIYVFLAKSEK